MNYSLGAYNKFNDTEQWIRITEGCPHHHEFCYEPTEIKVFGIPHIVRNKVKIMDMNLLCKPEALDIIKKLGEMKVDNKVVEYELICGIDFRFLTQEIANELNFSRFKKIRLAWDLGFTDQLRVKKAVEMLRKAGYSGHTDVMIFIICNWKVPYERNCLKLDLCKVWRVQVADCWFDNQTSPNIKPIYWDRGQIADFRRKCRMHNKMVTFGFDPEEKI